MKLPNEAANEVNHDDAPESRSESEVVVFFPGHVPRHFNWKLTVIAWVMFFGGFVLLLATEYFCRKLQHKNELAIPDEMGRAILIILGIASIYLLWVATNSQHHWLLRIAIVSLQGGIAFWLLLCLNLIYWIFLSDLPFKLI